MPPLLTISVPVPRVSVPVPRVTVPAMAHAPFVLLTFAVPFAVKVPLTMMAPAMVSVNVVLTVSVAPLFTVSAVGFDPPLGAAATVMALAMTTVSPLLGT